MIRRPVTLLLLATGAVACGGAEPKAPVCPPCEVSEGSQEPEQPPSDIEAEIEPELRVRPIAFSELPGWSGGEQAGVLIALRRSCARIARFADDRQVGRFSPLAGTAGSWRRACSALPEVAADAHEAARRFFEAEFKAYVATNRDEAEGLFTGYYEASLRGSRRRHGRYRIPIYGRPSELVMADMRDFTDAPKRRRIAGKVVNGRLKPYFDRAEIVGGALRGRKLELFWVDDPVDAFFTQIQGSGRIELDDGSVARIGYAAQNGHVYTAIGRELVREGHLAVEEASMQGIRKWLSKNPSEADDMMNRNRSFVFFAETKDGPYGSQNVVLTPGRSLAVDREFIAQTIPIWIDTEVPAEEQGLVVPWRRLVIAQDSGGAIRGPVRGDIFWGAGAAAAEIAGRTKSTGRYFLLLPAELEVPPVIRAGD